MKYLVFFIFVFYSISSSFAAKQDIVALVNDRPITIYDLNSRKKMIVTLNHIDDSNPAVRKKLDKQVLNLLIEEELLNQHAEKVGGNISEAEINNAIHSIEERNNMPKGHLFQYFKETGVSLKSFKDQIRAELIKYNIMSSLSGTVAVSPQELDSAIINASEKNFQIQGYIYSSLEDNDRSLKKMEKLRKEAAKCSNLKENLYSEFATSENIEDMLKKGLADKTRSVVLDTKEGSSSSIFRDEGKIKFVTICSKKAVVMDEDLSKVKIFLSNKKMSKKAEKFFKDLKTKAYIKIMLPD